MSQATDYTIDNSTGANVRSDINTVLGAIATNNSGGSDNGSIQALGFFANTSNSKLQLKNAAGNAFINLRGFDGSLPLPDGSASSPSLFFDDDTNTGIFSSAADTFNVATGGVERMELGATTIFNESGADVDFRIEGDTNANLFYVDAGNNKIGIGTSTPDTVLDVVHTNVSASAGTNDIAVFRKTDEGYIKVLSNNSGTGGIAFGDTDDNFIGAVRYDHGDDALEFFINNSERARIDASGHLLVGHSSGRNNFFSAVSTEHAPLIQLEGTNQNRILSITSSGNMDGGILALARQNGSTGANTVVADGNILGRIDFQGSGGTNMEMAASIHAEVDGTPGDNDMPGRLLFKTTADGSNNPTERMRIDSSGNVLIGTTTKGANGADELTLGTTGDTGMTIRSGSSSAGNIFFSDGTSGGDEYRGVLRYFHNTNAMVFNTDGTEKMRIDSSGNVGINESVSLMSNGKLTVKIDSDKHIGFNGVQGELGSVPALVAFQDNGSLADLGFRGNELKFATTTAERMRIDSSGRVLIGTTTQGTGSADDLTVSSSGSTGITIRSGTSNDGNLFFSDGTSGDDTFRGFLQYEHANNVLRFGTNSAEGMRIDSSGKLMVGGTTADAKFAVIDSSNPDIALRYNGTSGGHNTRLMFMDKRGVINAQVANVLINDNVGEATANLQFATANNGTLSTKMTVDNDGRVLINRTSGISAGLVNIEYDRNTFHGLNFIKNSGVGSNLVFFNHNTTVIGSISSDDSSTSYNTSSDYRLKENAVAISDGITRIKTLKPYKFNWIVDETNTLIDGFFAHEVSDAVPEAVTGTKDQVATDSDLGYTKGDPIYQQIDQSKLVPLLVAAVQELITKVETLEAA